MPAAGRGPAPALYGRRRYTLLIWAVGEGFGGPYLKGSTDVGTGIVYALLFVTLLVFAPPARRERLGLDRVLVSRWHWWRFLAEPHAVDRVRGAPLVEPVVVAETSRTPPATPGWARKPRLRWKRRGNVTASDGPPPCERLEDELRAVA